MKKKLMYEVPDVELIELKSDQGIICLSGDNTDTPIDDGTENF